MSVEEPTSYNIKGATSHHQISHVKRARGPEPSLGVPYVSHADVTYMGTAITRHTKMLAITL